MISLQVLVLFFIILSNVLSLYEPIHIDFPTCDSSLDDVHIITVDDDWDEINNPEKRIFCVNPGNYSTAGVISVTSAGTIDSKRYIMLINDNQDLHPGKMREDELAKVYLSFTTGSAYWIVDRLSSPKDARPFIKIGGGAHDIILNRLFANHYEQAVRVMGTEFEPYTRDNTIQNCRFEEMTKEGIDGDNVAVLLSTGNWDQNGTQFNTHIINNEFKNNNDGIQLIIHLTVSGIFAHYPGTVIHNNHNYIDRTMYSDGSGNMDESGKYAITENALDVKAGVGEPYIDDYTIEISSNIFWGWRQTDQTIGGSGSWGSAGVLHQVGPRNVHFKSNLFFDSNRGIGMSGVRNCVFENNVFYDIGFRPDQAVDTAAYMYGSENSVFRKNIIYTKDKTARWFNFAGTEMNLEVSDNVVLDSAQTCCGRPEGEECAVEGNFHYNTTMYEETDGVFYPSVNDAKHTDFTFTTDVFTNHPREITLVGIKPTAESPHVIEFPDIMDVFDDLSRNDDDDDNIPSDISLAVDDKYLSGCVLFVFLLFVIYL